MNKKLKEVISVVNDLSHVVSQNAETSTNAHNTLLNQIKSLTGQVAKAQSETDKLKNDYKDLENLVGDLLSSFLEKNSEIKDLKEENKYITQFIGLLVEHLNLDLEVVEPSCKLVSGKKQKAVKKTVKPKKSKKK